jgi:hypothetical protein
MATVNEFFLSSSQKKAVLDSVRARVIRDYEEPDRAAKGICSHIREVIAAVYHVSLLTHEIKDVFPKFTYENAKMVSEGNIYEPSEPTEYSVWWPLTPYDYNSRIRFISWLKSNL